MSELSLREFALRNKDHVTKRSRLLYGLSRRVERHMRAGELVFISAAKVKLEHKAGCFSGARYSTHFTFGLGILSSSSLDDVKADVLDLEFPTGTRCALLDWARSDAVLWDRNLSLELMGMYGLDPARLRNEVPHHFNRVNELEIYVGTEAVERLFARRDFFRMHRNVFEKLCQALGYENRAMRAAREAKHAQECAAVRSKFVSELPERVRAGLAQARELGIQDEEIFAPWKNFVIRK